MSGKPKTGRVMMIPDGGSVLEDVLEEVMERTLIR